MFLAKCLLDSSKFCWVPKTCGSSKNADRLLEACGYNESSHSTETYDNINYNITLKGHEASCK